jgi:hypothetical protein
MVTSYSSQRRRLGGNGPPGKLNWSSASSVIGTGTRFGSAGIAAITRSTKATP